MNTSNFMVKRSGFIVIVRFNVLENAFFGLVDMIPWKLLD